MNKIAVIMNTNELGGAERSMVFQLVNQHDNQFTFFLPHITESKALEKFLKSSGFNDISYYNYPRSLYSISRSSLVPGFGVFKDIYSLFFRAGEFASLNQFDMVYLNGNKAAFLFFAKNKLLHYKGKVVWHLRDYYHSSKLTNTLWKLLSNLKRENLSFICNSDSVKGSLAVSPWKNYPVQVIYNPVGEQLPVRDTARNIKTIGFVSMMAPWKGVHEIVLWCKLFEAELESLGITSVKIYGGDIYKTVGSHNSYSEQIKRLNTKFNSKLLSFQGHKEPKEIFQEIDCLIHYSLSPEPFGRVILEAFDAGIPVISTCLGGAGELVQSQVTGIKVFAHDRHGLFLAVEQLVENKVRTFKLISSGIEKSRLIQKNISMNMKRVLEIGEAS
ncbi:MAG: glycosyltransferase family 4 protein [Bacteriovorax sp.]|jgi:glycosyltransferase involved in cell wall biosynthesis